MKRRAFLFTCALAASASCGPVAGPPGSSLSINSCPEHACGAYQSTDRPTCSGGACVASRSFDFTLVASMPERSYYGAGMTVAVPSFSSAVQQSTPCSFPPNAPQNLLSATCFRVPQVLEPLGELLVETQTILSANASGSYIDTVGDPKAHTVFSQWSIPVHVQYWPLWPPPSSIPTQPSTLPVDAAGLGLPFVPIESPSLSFSPIGVGAPRGTPPTQWRTPLQPGSYERDIIPDNDAFPVVTSIVQAANDEYNSPLASVVPQTLTVSAPQPIPGYGVYLRDHATLRRVSSRFVMGADASESVTLLTVSILTSEPDLDLVISPPDGSPIPYLADPILAKNLGNHEAFPALPPSVVVSGNVEAPDGAPLQASLVIDSVATSGSVSGITTLPNDDPAQKGMHYSTTTVSDAHGHYTVSLPPGAYDVFVAPTAGSNAGATSVSLVIAIPLTTSHVAAGKNLRLAPLGVVTGIATVADGRPLSGATVQAQAAVSLAATVDPRRWPRAQTTTTDAKGAFSMSLDPGTYDIVVRPVDGTRFPWTTLSSQVVSAGKTLALTPMVVPAPQLIDLVLHDPGDNPLANAFIRAFAPASGATPATPGAPPPMIEIGSWMTDTEGHLTMLLAPPH